MVIGLLLVVVLASACGDPSSTDTASIETTPTSDPGVEPLIGLEVSSRYTARLVAVDGRGLVVVDGAAGGDGGRHVAATWVADGAERRAVDAERPPLVFPKARVVGQSIYVFGQECPDVDLALVSDIDQVPPEDVCGRSTTAHVVRRLDVETGTWSVVVPSVPQGPDGKAFLVAAVGTTFLVDAGELLAIDLDTGEPTAVPGASLAGAVIGEGCPVGDAILLVSTEVGPPGGGELPPAEPLDAWLVRGATASALALPSGLDASFAPVECLPGQGVVGLGPGRAFTAVTLDEDDSLRARPLDPPPGAEDARFQGAGTDLLAWVRDGKGLVPWRRQGDTWTRVGGRVAALDPPPEAIVVDGDTLVALNRRFTVDEPLPTTTVALI